MKRLICGRDEEIAEWTFDKFHLRPVRYDMAIGIVDDSELVGSVLWHAYNGDDIEISDYGPKTMTLGIARAMAKMAIDYWGVSRVSAKTARSNRKMTRGIKKIGFEWEGTKHCAYGDEDAIMYGLWGKNLYRLAGRSLQ